MIVIGESSPSAGNSRRQQSSHQPVCYHFSHEMLEILHDWKKTFYEAMVQEWLLQIEASFTEQRLQLCWQKWRNTGVMSTWGNEHTILIYIYIYYRQIYIEYIKESNHLQFLRMLHSKLSNPCVFLNESLETPSEEHDFMAFIMAFGIMPNGHAQPPCMKGR